MQYKLSVFALFVIIILSCTNQNQPTYEQIKDQLKNQTKLIELQTNNGASKLIVMPDFQGRIATSTNTGDAGPSLGWLNKNGVKNGERITGGTLHGEERIWIGPQGSQFSFYYGRKKPINEDNWSVPASFNDEPFQLITNSKNEVKLKKDIIITNFYGTTLTMHLDRKIYLFNKAEIEENLNIKLEKNLALIGYQTSHTLTNYDTVPWQKQTGLASPWSLSTFKGTNRSFTVIPINEGQDEDYFYYLNRFDKKRMVRSSDAIWYRTDGKFRSKLGIPPELSKSVFACYQPENNTLRIVRFRQRDDSLYFNSHVTIQDNPYKGEAIAIYNHGPMDLTEGKGNLFFEMESMAAMKELAPGESIEHYHQVYQFTGNFYQLNAISKKVLGIDLNDNPLQ